MTSKSLVAAALMASGFFASPALAGSDYNSNDIVKFFADSANLGQSRGLCVGTVEECDAVSRPKGFDMMINFDLDSAALTQKAQENLAEFAKALKDERLKAADFVVEGFTDASGPEAYNKGLSERRAESVTGFLIGSGVSRDRVEAMGLGESRPRVPDPMDPVNRRVEMRVKLR